MRLLLDTHAFLWFIGGDERLPMTAHTLIAEADNDVYVSVASLWEIAIKTSIGKLTLGKPFAELMPEQLAMNSMEVLPIQLDELATVVQLPWHHRDPFDRLLIAQAMERGLAIVGGDSAFAPYPVLQLWNDLPD